MNTASKNWLKQHLRAEIKYNTRRIDSETESLALTERWQDTAIVRLVEAEHNQAINTEHLNRDVKYWQSCVDRNKAYIKKLSFDLYCAQKILRSL